MYIHPCPWRRCRGLFAKGRFPMGYFKDMERDGTLGDEWDGPIPPVYRLPAVPAQQPARPTYCAGCSEVVEWSEPCECVFVVRGTLDDEGVLHTPARVDLGELARRLAEI